MSSNFVDKPGFHGDGDSSIELHHGLPSKWTSKQTIWSVSMVVIFIVVAVGLIMWALETA